MAVLVYLTAMLYQVRRKELINKKFTITGSSIGLAALLIFVFAIPGFTTQTNTVRMGCMNLDEANTISTLKINSPTLPTGFTLHCGQASLYEAEFLFADGSAQKGTTVKENLLEKIQNGAIHVHITDLKSKVGQADFQKEIGNVDEQIVKEYEHIKQVNPSLNPQIVQINGKKAWAYEACEKCGKQTATFEDGSELTNSFAVPARIEFYDDNGIRYFLESNRPLSDLIGVAKSLQP
jgi:hypothetical protein